jgi:GntR family transcriptional regulator/MocR family aminotransferase
MAPRNENAIWSGLFQISVDSGQTLQAQIRQAVVSAILDRQISVTMPLPSCRVLAQKLGVARGTVVLAFQQLVDQGFLVARERRGHFVNPDVLALPEKPSRKKAAKTKTGLDWRARRKMSPDQFPELRKPENWIKFNYPFVYGQFDPTLFPTAEWRECNRMALAVLEIRDWASDMIDRDDPLLIEQIQARLLPRRGIFASPDEIMVTLGAQHALYMLASLLMNRGARVAVEDPGYIDARNIFRLLGAETVPVPVDDAGLRVSELPADCGFVFVTPSHQCPTMVSLTPERRRLLLKAADANDQVIIEDDYDSQLFDDTPQPALKSLDDSGRVIYVGSMSKTLAPGLRLGYIVGSADLIAELRALRRYMLRHPPANNQRAVALFLSLGHHDALVRKLSQAFGERRDRLVDAVSGHLPEWSAGSATSGTSVWLKGPDGVDTKQLAEAAAARSVLIEPGDVFFAGAGKPANYMRLGISSIALQHIEPGIRQLAIAAGRQPAAA